MTEKIIGKREAALDPASQRLILQEILESMQFPPKRILLNNVMGLLWINRHLAINYLSHPRSKEAQSLVQSLLKSEVMNLKLPSWNPTS